jgi:hypothetical protein
MCYAGQAPPSSWPTATHCWKTKFAKFGPTPFCSLDSPPKLRAHEEGHRAIGEHYYARSAPIAEDIGRRLIGRSYEGRGVDDDAAQRDAFGKVVAELESAYMARVRVPSAAANERFDEITKHGLAAIDEDEAVALAVAPR